MSDVEFELDGRAVRAADGVSLLEALRDQLGARGPKDGCSPQGQCGCCTVLVDGAARVACVTPVARVRGRSVETIDGVESAERWAAAFAACGASQCGFCTPGIITRLAALPPDALLDPAKIDRALLAHLCRCTGWQTIHEACVRVANSDFCAESETQSGADSAQSRLRAAERASIEGRTPQQVGSDIALGRGGFADDTAPADALVAVRGADGDWVVGDSLAAARAAAGKVQGRRTTAPPTWPVDVPAGDFVHTLQTTWVEPAYLEPDASWCEPGGTPVTSLANGGAFGGKTTTDVGEIARRLADEHGRTVRVLWSREDTVRFGPKRPPLGIGVRRDGSVVVRAARPTVGPGVETLELGGLDVEVEWVEVGGPPISLDLRAAVWAEVAAAHAVAIGSDAIQHPDGAIASATIGDDGAVQVMIDAGDPLDTTTLRSYCIGAAHLALGMVRSESLSLDADGAPRDLTIRSFGVLRSVDTPAIEVDIRPSGRPAVNGSDAVFAAVLAAAWRAAGLGPRWPV